MQPSEEREWGRDEVRACGSQPAALLIVEGAVYDVQQFLAEHPGGAGVLRRAAGCDATRCWRDAQHSPEARALMARYRVGRLRRGDLRDPPLPADEPPPDAPDSPDDAPPPDPPAAAPPTLAALLDACGAPLALATLAALLHYYLFW